MSLAKSLKLLSRDELVKLVEEMVRYSPGGAQVVHKYLQQHALKQIKTAGSDNGGDRDAVPTREKGRTRDLLAQAVVAYEAQVDDLVVRWRDEAVSLELQRYWDDSACLPLEDILEEIGETFVTVENLRAGGQAVAAVRCLLHFLDVTVRAQAETAAAESYGAHDGLSLEDSIDRARDLLDAIMRDDLSPGEVRDALERLRPLADVDSGGGRDIVYLITAHEAKGR